MLQNPQILARVSKPFKRILWMTSRSIRWHLQGSWRSTMLILLGWRNQWVFLWIKTKKRARPTKLSIKARILICLTSHNSKKNFTTSSRMSPRRSRKNKKRRQNYKNHKIYNKRRRWKTLTKHFWATTYSSRLKISICGILCSTLMTTSVKWCPNKNKKP